MISKKVCMVGAYAVGKTSLVRRFVDNIYDDEYLTTIGVKVDRTVVQVDTRSVNVVLWDMAGEDALTELRLDHIRGSSGFILVADCTRPATVEAAISLKARIHAEYGDLPFMLALNKVDLVDSWSLTAEQVEFLERSLPGRVLHTSARTGGGVEELFLALAGKMIER